MGRVALVETGTFELDEVRDKMGDDAFLVIDVPRGGKIDQADVAHKRAEQLAGRLHDFLSLLVTRAGLADDKAQHD